MNTGFWKNLKKPIMCLAPMANVTDASFRWIIAKYGKPDIMWTEFVSADGLTNKEGRKKLLLDLKYSESERPIVAQIFGAKPYKIEEAGKIIGDLGFDGLDINMGCPDRAVLKQGAGGALIKNPKLAQEIILSAKQGAGDLPVSIKTRIGFSKNELQTWLPALLEVEPVAITIHARTVKELSEVPARWDHIKEAVLIRNRLKSKTLILGNGDVRDLDEAKKLAKKTCADGVMIGRAIFGNPFLFGDERLGFDEIDIKRKLEVLVEHTKLFEKLFIGKKKFDMMKKHFKAYVSGFEGAKDLRIKLMETNDASGVKKIIGQFLRP